MGLRQLRGPLRDEVLSRKHEATFEEGRRREPSLAAHDTILSVLAVMHDESERRYAERDEVTRALIREQQAKPGPFWSSVLLIAYAPMLLRLRGRICGDAIAKEDLDQLALEAFLEVIARFPLSGRANRIAMHLRQDTQRAVFRRLRAEQQSLQSLSGLEEKALANEDFQLFSSSADEQPIDDEGREELVELFVAAVGDRITPAKLEVIVATHLRGECLRDYVVRRYGELDAEARETVYQRLKRERLRTLGKLRPLFYEDASLPPVHPALRMLSAASLRREERAMTNQDDGDALRGAFREVTLTVMGACDLYDTDPAIVTALARGLGEIVRARLPDLARPRRAKGREALLALLNEIDRKNEVIR